MWIGVHRMTTTISILLQCVVHVVEEKQVMKKERKTFHRLYHRRLHQAARTPTTAPQASLAQLAQTMSAMWIGVHRMTTTISILLQCVARVVEEKQVRETKKKHQKGSGHG